MLYVFLVPHAVVQGAGCARKPRCVTVRGSLYYAPFLAESPRPEPMLYWSTPTLGEVYDTLLARSCKVMTYAYIAENDKIVCPQVTTRTIPELGD